MVSEAELFCLCQFQLCLFAIHDGCLVGEHTVSVLAHGMDTEV